MKEDMYTTVLYAEYFPYLALPYSANIIFLVLHVAEDHRGGGLTTQFCIK